MKRIEYKENKVDKFIDLKDNWSNITISEFIQIRDILESKNIDDIDKSAAIIAILINRTEKDVLEMDVKLFSELCKYLNFLTDTPTAVVTNSYLIDNMVYILHTNMNKITTSQYLDLMHLSKERNINENIHKILSLILIPSENMDTLFGKKIVPVKFGTYDVEEVADIILNNFSIADGYAIMVFFSKLYSNLMDHTTSYLVKETKNLLLKSKKLTKELQIQVKNIPTNGDGLRMLNELQTTLIEAGNKSMI